MVTQLATPPTVQGQVGPPALTIRLLEPVTIPLPGPRPVREATLTNIAYGLHRCDEAEITITTTMLREMGACADRFKRLENNAGTYNATSVSLGHEWFDDILSEDDVDDDQKWDDLVWFLTNISLDHNQFRCEEDIQALEQVLEMIYCMHGQPLQIVNFQGKQATGRRMIYDIAQHETIVISPTNRIGAYGKPLYERERTQRTVDFGRALMELVTHDFVKLEYADDDSDMSCCQNATVQVDFSRLEVSVDVVCDCGEEDTLEVILMEHRSTQEEWECGSCGHTHYIDIPRLSWR